MNPWLIVTGIGVAMLFWDTIAPSVADETAFLAATAVIAAIGIPKIL